MSAATVMLVTDAIRKLAADYALACIAYERAVIKWTARGGRCTPRGTHKRTALYRDIVSHEERGVARAMDALHRACRSAAEGAPL